MCAMGGRVAFSVSARHVRPGQRLSWRPVLDGAQRRDAVVVALDVADRVRWTARDDGDGLGYDVLSYTIDGHERYIEVKTTALGALTPFYLSSAELQFARSHPQSYALYRVYAVDARPPRFFALQGNDILQLELIPVTYRACVPAENPNGQKTTNGLDH